MSKKTARKGSRTSGGATPPKVPNHINYALVEKTRPAMYRSFKYWGKKPHNIFSEYIRTYTKKGDIVLDAFAGSGIGPMEAVQADRKAIAVDYNPLSVFMMRILSAKFDKPRFMAAYEKIMSAAEEEEAKTGFFFTTCTSCGNKKARVTSVHWGDVGGEEGAEKFRRYAEGLKNAPSLEQFIKNVTPEVSRNGSVPVLVRYECAQCDSKMGKIADKKDADIIKKSDADHQIPYWTPDDEFPQTAPFEIVRNGVGRHYVGLWTKRVLWLTAFIYQEIEGVEDKETRDFLKFAFISSVHLSSKMVASRQPTTNRLDSGSWGRSAYILLSWHMEQNPVVLFKRAVKGRNGLLNAKKSSEALLGNKVHFARNIADLRDDRRDKNLLILQMDVLDLSKKLGNNCVDYIITDPPYGGLVQYFSLSSLWTVWLKHNDPSFEIPYDGEITMNDNNDFDRYHTHLTAALREIRKVLKPGGYMTLTFHNKEINVWNSVIKAGYVSGFDFEKIIYQPNKRAGEAGVANPHGAAISDYYLRFRKPETDVAPENIREMSPTEYERIVIQTAESIIADRGEPTELTHILNGIYADLYIPGRIFKGESKDITRILNDEVNKTFITFTETVGRSKKVRWWLSSLVNPEVALSSRVEWVVVNMLKRNERVIFDEVLGELFVKFPNGLTPETQSVMDVLRQHAIKARGGYWRNNPRLPQTDSPHSEMIYHLSKIGDKFGMKICVGKRERGDFYKSTKLSTLCTEKTLALKGFSKESIGRIENIDVVWYNKDGIQCMFEVENSTGFIDAITRGSHIPPNPDIRRFFVLPKNRVRELRAKMQDPAFKEYYHKFGWQTILYSDLQSLARRRNPEPSDLYKLGRELP